VGCVLLVALARFYIDLAVVDELHHVEGRLLDLDARYWNGCVGSYSVASDRK
jgi:hypothetical protein